MSSGGGDIDLLWGTFRDPAEEALYAVYEFRSSLVKYQNQNLLLAISALLILADVGFFAHAGTRWGSMDERLDGVNDKAERRIMALCLLSALLVLSVAQVCACRVLLRSRRSSSAAVAVVAPADNTSTSPATTATGARLACVAMCAGLGMCWTLFAVAVAVQHAAVAGSLSLLVSLCFLFSSSTYSPLHWVSFVVGVLTPAASGYVLTLAFVGGLSQPITAIDVGEVLILGAARTLWRHASPSLRAARHCTIPTFSRRSRLYKHFA